MDVLNERLGIPDAVIEKVNEIYPFIISDMKKMYTGKIPQKIIGNGIRRYEGKFDTTFMDNSVKIRYTYYDFPDMDEYIKNREELNVGSGRTEIVSGTGTYHITLTVMMITGGGGTRYLSSMLQHEFTHVYQAIRKEKKGIPALNTEIYKKAYSILDSNPNGVGCGIDWFASVIIYYSDEKEQEAICGSIYSIARNATRPAYGYEAMPFLDAWHCLQVLSTLVSLMDSSYGNPDVESAMEKTFGLSVRDLVRLGRDGERRFRRRFGRAISRCANDGILPPKMFVKGMEENAADIRNGNAAIAAEFKSLFLPSGHLK